MIFVRIRIWTTPHPIFLPFRGISVFVSATCPIAVYWCHWYVNVISHANLIITHSKRVHEFLLLAFLLFTNYFQISIFIGTSYVGLTLWINVCARTECAHRIRRFESSTELEIAHALFLQNGDRPFAPYFAIHVVHIIALMWKNQFAIWSSLFDNESLKRMSACDRNTIRTVPINSEIIYIDRFFKPSCFDQTFVIYESYRDIAGKIFTYFFVLLFVSFTLTCVRS